MNRFGVILLALCLWLSATVSATETVLWDKEPIPIKLVVGVEQIIHLPNSAAIGLPPELADRDVMRTLLVGDTVYLKALTAFKDKRTQFRLAETGEIIIIDFSAEALATPPAQVEPVRVVLDRGQGQDPASPVAQNTSIFDPLRYGVQNLYAPGRLVESLPGIREVSFKPVRNLKHIYYHDDHRFLDMWITDAWTTGKHFVTAIGVRNKSSSAVPLEMFRFQHTHKREMFGFENHFVAVATLEGTLDLQPLGEIGDAGHVFIVTDRPFNQVLDL